jgi:hypothetical protein
MQCIKKGHDIRLKIIPIPCKYNRYTEKQLRMAVNILSYPYLRLIIYQWWVGQ